MKHNKQIKLNIEMNKWNCTNIQKKKQKQLYSLKSTQNKQIKIKQKDTCMLLL